MKLPFENYKRTTLIKKKAETSSKYGTAPNKRTTEQLIKYGIVNIDKPSGPTSHQVSAYVKQILNLKKTGHSGTLDPRVTGCLPVALENGTRVVQSLLTAGKEYICNMHLHDEITDKQLAEVFEQFTGRIKQLPPVKSAVKRQWRYRKVYYIEMLDRKEKEVLFRVGTEAGTYIRKLVHDIGKALNSGAHMAELRRSKAGPFSENKIHTLQDLADAYHYYKEGNDKELRKIIQPIEAGVSHLKKIHVFDSAVKPLTHGQTLKAPGVVTLDTEIQVDDKVAVFTLKDELILVGRAKMTSKDILAAEKGIVLKSEQVFMDNNLYPKFE